MQARTFEDKTFLELLQSTAVYRLCASKWLADWTPSIIRAGKAAYLERPMYWFIRHTIFKQFCGGENLEEVKEVASRLAEKNVKIMLDYAAEPDISPSHTSAPQAADLAGFYYDRVRDNTFFAIDAVAGTVGSVVSVKTTGLFRNNVLEELTKALGQNGSQTDFRASNFYAAYEVGRQRLQDICNYAKKKDVGLAIDAEQSFVQDAIDHIALDVMRCHNAISTSKRPLVINTYQLYRKDGLVRLKLHLEESRKLGFHFGAKLVRGAYVVGERIWAEEYGHECPIFDSAQESHKQYDDTIEAIFTYISSLQPSDRRKFAIIFATHNFDSLRKAAGLFRDNIARLQQADISFAQLYGMSDATSFSLAEAGYPVYKYLPFGPVPEVVPYLIRRAQENSSVFQLAQSDATLMRTEMRRRLWNSSPNN
jgi:hypothetical protein